MMLMMTMMMTMMMMNDERGGQGKSVELDLRSVYDVSEPARVRVPSDSTLIEAVEMSNVSPVDILGLEVFTRSGEKVSHYKSKDYVGRVLLVGPAAITAEASEIEIRLDPEDDVEPRHEPMTKSVTFVSAYDPSVRHEVVPQPGQSIRDAAQMAGLAPRDGSGWTVYDAVGIEVDQRPSDEMIGDVLYVGMRAVAAGGYNGDRSCRGRGINEPSFHSYNDEFSILPLNLTGWLNLFFLQNDGRYGGL
tara:strand:- start:7629 stop:8369 length:741 start_codon:yes stop_codon:yes gene_type:complete